MTDAHDSPFLIAVTETRQAARRRATQILAPVSGVEAALDARILLEEATGLEHLALLGHGNEPIGQAAAVILDGYLRRRLQGEPLWRVIGEREFWGLRFAITPAVLDPRPDTETLVAAVLGCLSPPGDRPLRVLDLGVGSGAILCAILHERPDALGWGVDRSEAACRVARRNVDALGLGARTLVLNADWASALADGPFDLVVSNPPYIETAVLPTLSREVRDHDPPLALDGGPDGLTCYRDLAMTVPRLLAPGGLFGLEHGSDQASTVESLLTAAGFRLHGRYRDLGGNERTLVAGLAKASTAVASS